MPSWIFFQASEAVKMHESRMPATVKVPPMMAQICKRAEESVCQRLELEEALGRALYTRRGWALLVQACRPCHDCHCPNTLRA